MGRRNPEERLTLAAWRRAARGAYKELLRGWWFSREIFPEGNVSDINPFELEQAQIG